MPTPREQPPDPSGLFLTARGRFVRTAGWALLCAGLLLDIAPAVSSGLFLLLLLFFARRLARVNLRGLDLDLLFPEAVYRHRPFCLELRLRTPRRILPAFDVAVLHPLLHDLPVPFSSVPAGAVQETRLRKDALRKGHQSTLPGPYYDAARGRDESQ